VGRAKECSAFTENLARAPDDSGRWLVVSVTGPVGIGKTELIRAFADMAEESGAAVAYYVDTGQDDLVDVLAAVVDQLPLGGFGGRRTRGEFHDKRRRLRELRAELAKDPEWAEPARPLVQGAAQLAATVTAGPIGVLAAPVAEKISEGATELAAWAQRRLRREEDRQLVLETEATFSRLFVAALRRASEDRSVLVALDDMDRSHAFSPSWLPKLVSGAWGEVRRTVLFVVGSTQPLDRKAWEDCRLDDRMRTMRLEPFSDQETRELLGRRGIDDPEQVSAVSDSAQGLPALIDAMVAHGHVVLGGSPEDVIAESVLPDDPVGRGALLHASAARVLNADVLAVIDGPEAGAAGWGWLTARAAVAERSSGVWQLDHTVRRLLVRRLRSVSPDRYRQIHEQLAEWYSGFAAGRREAPVEAAYHRASAAGTAAFRLVLPPLSDLGSDTARSVSDALVEAGADSADEELHHSGKRLADLVAAWRQSDWRAADAAIGELRSLQLGPEVDARLASWRASLLITQSSPNEVLALAELDQALASAPDDLEYRSQRAALQLRTGTYRSALLDLDVIVERQDGPVARRARAALRILSGELPLALEDLDALLARLPNDVEALVQRAQVRLTSGDHDGALADAARATVLRPEDPIGRLVHAWIRARRREPGATQELADISEQQAAAIVRVVAGDDDDPDARQARARAIMSWARAHGLADPSLGRLIDAAVTDRDGALRIARAAAAVLRAQAHVEGGDLPAARASLDAAVGLDPDESRYAILRAAVEVDSLGAEATIANVEQSTEAGRHVALGAVLLWRNDYDGALRSLEQAVRERPDDLVAMGLQAQALLAAQRSPEAIPVLRRITEIEPDDWRAWFMLAYLCAASGELEEAAAAAERLADEASVAIPAVFGRVQWGGKQARGLGAARELLRDPMTAVSELRSSAATWRAMARWERSERHAALTDLRHAVEQWPDELFPWLRSFDYLAEDPGVAGDAAPTGAVGRTWAAAVLLGRGELDAALELITSEPDGEPRLAASALVRSRIRAKQGDLAGGLAELDEAVRRAPGVAGLRLERGKLLEGLDRPADALAEYTEAIEAGAPLHPELRFRRGELLRLQGQLEDALTDFGAALMGAPDSPLLLGSIAQALAGLKRWRDALTYADRALSLDGGLSWVRELRAEVRDQLGDWAGALADAEAVATADPTRLPARRGWAFLLLKAGRPAAGLEVVRGVLDGTAAGPPDDDARAWFRQLEVQLLVASGPDKAAEAVAAAERLLDEMPSWPDGPSVLVEALRMAGRPAEALERADATPLDARTVELAHAAGAAAIEAGRPEKAEQWFRMALEWADEGFSRYELGRALRHQGRGEEADALTREALEADDAALAAATGGTASLLCNRALYLLALGRLDEGLDSYREALALQPPPLVIDTARMELRQLRAAGGPPEDIAAAEALLAEESG
jgi:tetratricopeptide (TPR) repeat protein